MVQWLRLKASTVGGTGWAPGQGTRIPRARYWGQKEKETCFPHKIKNIFFKIEIEFTCERHPFKIYNSMVFSVFTEWCNQHCYLSLEHFITFQRNVASLTVTHLLPTPSHP